MQKATLDNLREAVAVFSADGRLRLYNDAFTELWELAKTKLEDGPDFDAVIDQCSRLYPRPQCVERRSRAASPTRRRNTASRTRA